MYRSLINPKAIGDVCKDLGQIFFASVFLTSLMGDKINYYAVFGGLILAIAFWLIYIKTRNY